MHHFVGEDAQRPPISAFIIPSSLEHLGSKILRCPTEGFGSLAVSNDLGHSKIS
jgi:hypothetical protein